MLQKAIMLVYFESPVQASVIFPKLPYKVIHAFLFTNTITLTFGEH